MNAIHEEGVADGPVETIKVLFTLHEGLAVLDCKFLPSNVSPSIGASIVSEKISKYRDYVELIQ